MKCPYCGNIEQKVLDSRPARDGSAIRRRRECDHCNRRFTTFEEPEKPRLLVIKRSGARVDFDREKLLNSMVLACGKRPVTLESLQASCLQIERELFDSLEQEIPSTEIGNKVMAELAKLDSVGYIRYASVYREFEDPQEFADIVRRMVKEKTKAKS